MERPFADEEVKCNNCIAIPLTVHHHPQPRQYIVHRRFDGRSIDEMGVPFPAETIAFTAERLLGIVESGIDGLTPVVLGEN